MLIYVRILWQSFRQILKNFYMHLDTIQNTIILYNRPNCRPPPAEQNGTLQNTTRGS